VRSLVVRFGEVSSRRFGSDCSREACGVPPARETLANKKRICCGALMPVRSCRVTIQDMDGVSHTVEVTAATLYEAVAQGLAAICGNEWVAGIAERHNVVRVSVADVRVEHEVKLMDFTKWLERSGGSPREVSERHKIRTILGMPVSR
jgi:hypothetical protein